MTDPQLVKEVEDRMDKWMGSPYRHTKKYGVFYKGQLLTLSKARIYKQPGRAKAEVRSSVYSEVNQILHRTVNWQDPNRKVWSHEEVNKLAAEVLDELIKNGVIEIKEVL